MTWVRLDDMFAIHKKIASLSDSAFRLHVAALCWSARNLADGYLDEEDLTDAWPRLRTPQRYTDELVRRGIWHVNSVSCTGQQCPPEVDKPGWRIHDYWVYQFSKEQVMSQRAAARERQSRHRHGVSHGVTDGVSHAAPGPSRPVDSSVSTSAEGWRPARDPKTGISSSLNGAATRQPPPFAEAQQRALHPDSEPKGRHAKEAP